MGWTMAAVDAPASAVKRPLADIPADVQEAVEEGFAFCQENPAKRLVPAFDSEKARDDARVDIRSYCEARPKGRLTASIWAGFAGREEVEGVAVDRFSATATEVCVTPALSVTFRPYVKREKGSAGDAPASE